jgi:hypothetical protein
MPLFSVHINPFNGEEITQHCVGIYWASSSCLFIIRTEQYSLELLPNQRLSTILWLQQVSKLIGTLDWNIIQAPWQQNLVPKKLSCDDEIKQ